MRRRTVLGLLATLPMAGCAAFSAPEEPNLPAQGYASPPPSDGDLPTDGSPAPIDLAIDPTTPTGPAATVEFTVTNNGDRPLVLQETGYQLHKHVDGAWRRFSPYYTIAALVLVTVDPGDSYTYELTVDNTDLADTEYTDDGLALGPGQYHFSTNAMFDDPGTPTPATEPDTHTVSTSFTIDADPLPLPVGDGMAVDDRTDGTATVVPADRTPSETGEVATLVVRRTDRKHVPDRGYNYPSLAGNHLYTEELLNAGSGTLRAIRNALAAFSDTTREVRLHAPDHAIPPFGLEPDEQRYAYYDGYVYEFESTNWDWDEV